MLEFKVDGLPKNEFLSLDDLLISYDISINQHIKPSAILHRKSKNVFLLDFTSFKNGVYEIIPNLQKYKIVNQLSFIKNKQTKNLKKTLGIEKLAGSPNDVNLEFVPYVIINSQRQEWWCYLKNNFKKDLLDPFLSDTTVFVVEWNDSDRVSNIFFEKEPKSIYVKQELERLLYSIPKWGRPTNDQGEIFGTYKLLFKRTTVYFCN